MGDAENGFDLNRYFRALDRWEPGLDAWAYRPTAAGMGTVAEAPEDGPLAGVPFAVKDVIDVRGQPTRYGSDAFPDAGPAPSDAPVVRALRVAGAIPVGKTRSTEFAFIDPTTTRNPHDQERSPGGSSGGSGAVVGAGVVPFALGTQTAGSLCRPAAYCGAAAYKPGLGVLPTNGMSPLSPSFDAIGIIAQSPAWLSKVYDVLAASFAIPPNTQSAPGKGLAIGFVNVPDQKPDPAMQAMMAVTVERLSGAGHRVQTVDAPIRFGDIIQSHRTVMLFEMAENLASFVHGREALLQPLFRAALAEGAGITPQARSTALAAIKQALVKFWAAVSEFDLLLAYPVPGAAPNGLKTTGDQSYLTPWTAMGGPLFSLPSGQDTDGMPLSVLLAAAPGRDSFLVCEAVAIAGCLPQAPAPANPITA